MSVSSSNNHQKATKILSLRAIWTWKPPFFWFLKYLTTRPNNPTNYDNRPDILKLLLEPNRTRLLSNQPESYPTNLVPDPSLTRTTRSTAFMKPKQQQQQGVSRRFSLFQNINLWLGTRIFILSPRSDCLNFFKKIKKKIFFLIFHSSMHEVKIQDLMRQSAIFICKIRAICSVKAVFSCFICFYLQSN